MSQSVHHAAPAWLQKPGDFRWLRGHISVFFVGTVLLVCTNLMVGGSTLWSVTATGIWLLLLVVHVLILAIARLSATLIAEGDEEEIVLLPVQDAVIVTPAQPQTWSAPPVVTDDAQAPQPEADEPVSWQVAIDAARGRKRSLSGGENDS